MAKKSKQFNANLAYSTNPTPEQQERRRLVLAPLPSLARMIPGKSWAGCYIRDEVGEAVIRQRDRHPVEDDSSVDSASGDITAPSLHRTWHRGQR